MGNRMTLADCIDLATFAHRHQYDKAGEPYIKHPLRVLKSVQDGAAQPFVQMAAVLHDVTEDTPFTADMLIALGVPEAAVEIVKLVDRDHSKIVWVHSKFGAKAAEKHREFIQTASKDELDEFYYMQIKSNPGAVQVKLADIGDNLQPWRLNYLPPETQDRLRRKYAKAIRLLSPQSVNDALVAPYMHPVYGVR